MSSVLRNSLSACHAPNSTAIKIPMMTIITSPKAYRRKVVNTVLFGALNFMKSLYNSSGKLITFLRTPFDLLRQRKQLILIIASNVYWNAKKKPPEKEVFQKKLS